MAASRVVAGSLFIVAGALAGAVAAEPVRVFPENPHYFSRDGKPILLVTSYLPLRGGDRPEYTLDLALRLRAVR
jgi:hypothetical protein